MSDLKKSTVCMATSPSEPTQTTNDATMWKEFAEQEHLSAHQLAQFQKYMELLLDWNQRKNLTAITQPHAVLSLHFQDSLRLANLVTLAGVQSIADVGSGGGFPGIPLKIMYPHLNVVLIEVNQKKRDFLNAVIETLDLKGIQVSSFDWRSFLHQKQFSIDIFCARASLQVPELLRVFGPESVHQKARMVYWASRHFEPTEAERLYIKRQDTYTVEDRVRKIILFGDPRR